MNYRLKLLDGEDDATDVDMYFEINQYGDLLVVEEYMMHLLVATGNSFW